MPADYSATFRAESGAVAVIRGEVAAIAAQCGLGEAELLDVRIAVSEIVTNAIIHAYRGEPGEIRIRAGVVGGSLQVVVCDDGPGMAPRIGSPGLGLGLPTAATAAKDLSIESPPGGGTRVKLTFACPSCVGCCGAGSS